MRTKLLFLIALIFIVACQPANIKNQLIELGAIPSDHTSEYLTVYKKHTVTNRIYEEFETKCIISVTPFTKEFLEAYLKERMLFLKENDFLTLQDRERQVNEKNIKFFVSFYTPNPDFSDLEKPNSIWQVYLEKSDKTRLLPLAIRKSSESYPVTNHFFPSLDPWSSPYIVIFPRFKDEKVNLKDGEEFKLVFKSVIGTSIFNFKNI